MVSHNLFFVVLFKIPLDNIGSIRQPIQSAVSPLVEPFQYQSPKSGHSMASHNLFLVVLFKLHSTISDRSASRFRAQYLRSLKLFSTSVPTSITNPNLSPLTSPHNILTSTTRTTPIRAPVNSSERNMFARTVQVYHLVS
ncbi:hypothetical protein K461DRAFT_61841 [Myriangium duriaei CBS 260.36]|uniref:Uncharacterized protein n=1 Tax=Myriangium duriaei CBS 260.36 TaxID=1168546 RepID=A0A9P4ITF3_9PEZI|nr:hypothetical protein K461DRAFT_61841 [Myriangium duriaei CBS 260.36]